MNNSIIVDMLKIHPLHIGQVFRLAGAVSLNGLCSARLQDYTDRSRSGSR